MKPQVEDRTRSGGHRRARVARSARPLRTSAPRPACSRQPRPVPARPGRGLFTVVPVVTATVGDTLRARATTLPTGRTARTGERGPGDAPVRRGAELPSGRRRPCRRTRAPHACSQVAAAPVLTTVLVFTATAPPGAVTHPPARRIRAAARTDRSATSTTCWGPCGSGCSSSAPLAGTRGRGARMAARRPDRGADHAACGGRPSTSRTRPSSTPLCPRGRPGQGLGGCRRRAS